MMEFMYSWAKISFFIVLSIWFATGAAIVSRLQLVFDYSTLPLVPPEYEVIAGSSSALIALAIVLIGSLVHSMIASWHANRTRPAPSLSPVREHKIVAVWLIATLPCALLVLRIIGIGVPEPGWWELLWFAGWTGYAIRTSPWEIDSAKQSMDWFWLGSLTLATLICAGWWYAQSVSYYSDHQLGFNDFGHFTQRISNTARGNGILLESPVLPPFWDHFNPGLLLIVPLWSINPRVELIFAIQALCLAGSALLVAGIALARRQSAAAACGWGGAWLLIPSVGQMNLAYTYGWHPITLAIPCLLAAYLSLLVQRPIAAVILGVVAASFEEGVFVAIACFAASQMIRVWWDRRSIAREAEGGVKLSNEMRIWGIVTVVAVIGFVCVYRFSGLAPFQTGRFARLGSNAFEIILSPIARPQEFLGLALRPRNLAFTCLVMVPFAIVATRTWLWALLAVTPPWCVLLIWEHMPAQCLAFQYLSCLLPILFVGVIEQRSSDTRPEARAWGLLAIGWLLSICIGQLPWSNDSLVDVKAKTYGVPSRWKREHTSEDGELIRDWISTIRFSGTDPVGNPLPEWKRLRVLATGRIAAHCVGTSDVETVGQFRQRYDALKGLDPELASPILRYDVILLDFRESFQQTTEETESVLQEAEKHGWKVRARQFDLAILTR